eukprot:13216149-Alexandrium_andersonii.AAC.1
MASSAPYESSRPSPSSARPPPTPRPRAEGGGLSCGPAVSSWWVAARRRSGPGPLVLGARVGACGCKTSAPASAESRQ